MKYLFERSYPYINGIVLSFILYKNNINYISNKNLGEAIDGVITISSLIIGFIGAVLPVILSMKNDSKFVKYVFEEDKNQLFLKYMKEDILSGIVLIGISISMYFRDDFVETWYYKYVFYVWILNCTIFLGSTYRCVNNMLNLIFSKDKEINKYNSPPETEREKKFREELINKN